MDNPVYGNDLIYLQELIIISIVTVAITIFCFRYSQKADRRRAQRLAKSAGKTMQATPTAPGARKRPVYSAAKPSR